MSNPFHLPDGKVQISFSGGRTSAYMLHRLLEANGDLPEDRVQVVFSNTGREMPQTLDFVAECGRRWGVMIVWLEYRPTAPFFEVVGRQGASTDGAPFDALLAKRKMLPHVRARFCTQELKVRPAAKYLRSLGWDRWTAAIGIRADEPERVRPAEHRERWTRWHPLAEAGITKANVIAWWSRQDFDLDLPTINGKTTLGNCDGCFLKSEKALAMLARDYPDRHAWWEEREAWFASTKRAGEGNTWSKRFSRRDLREFMERQGDFFLSEQGHACQKDEGDCFG